MSINKIEQGIQMVLEGLNSQLGMDIDTENFRETPNRVARSFLEILSGEKNTEEKINVILSKSFPTAYKGMIVETGIRTFSMCPHHLLPVSYITDVGYIPGNITLGISKLARIVDVHSKRAILQEDFTEEIYKSLMKIKPAGVMIRVRGKHLCMGCRGIKQPQVETITSRLQGLFEESTVREEFMLLLTKRQ